jgi:hypothetical protein
MALTWVKIANLKGPKGDAGDTAAMNRFDAIEAKNNAQDARLDDLPNQYTPLSRGVLANNTNLNTLTGPQHVGTYSMPTANTYTNAPTTTSTATLEVQRGSGNTLSVVQRITYGNVMLWREATDTSAGTWSAWAQVQTVAAADAKNSEQDGRLTTAESKNSAQDGRLDTLEADKWLKAVDNTTTDLNGYTTPGRYQVTKSGVANRPFAASGDLEVFAVGSIVTQKWTTTEASPRIFTRTRNGGTWTAWSNATWSAGVLSSSASLDDLTTPGSYTAPNAGTLGKPVTASGNVVVYAIGPIITQIYLTLEAKQREFVRQYVGGAWTAWDYLTWYQGLLPNGTDFNTLTRPAEHGITFTAHPNQPIAKAGSLTVKASSGDVIQEFTPVGDNPDVYRRRLPAAGVWGAWGIRAFSTSSTPGGATTAGPGDPTRAALGVWSPTLTATNSGDIITEYNKDRTVGFNGNHSAGRLKETRDNGATWTDLKVFADPFTWVRQLDNGELLACTKVDPDPRELWLSSGYGTGTVTWSKVLTAHAPYATFNASWGFSTYKNIVLMAEYGPKLPTWNGNTVTENARYVYMSLDSGKTWATVFDLNAYLATQGRSTPTGNHVHGVAWDPYWDRIWVTFGDDTNGILYSDDLGVTWQTAFYGAVNNDPYQVVGIIAMPKAILFGTDVAPNGVQRIDRAQGKRAGTYPIEQAYTIPGDDGVTRTNLCQAIHRVRREGDDGPVLFGFSAETNPAPSFIVGTYDGFNFKLLWQDTINQPAGLGIRTIAGPSLTGELVVGSNDGRVVNMWTKLTGPAPIY